jgi:hypothetical protein
MVSLRLPVAQPGFPQRPWTFWLYAFDSRGWTLALRLADGLELLASRQTTESWESARAGWLADETTLAVTATGEPFYFLAPPITSETLACYGINPSFEPCRLHITWQNTDEHHPDLYIGDLKCHYLGHHQSGDTIIHAWEPVSMPPGGKPFTFRGDLEMQRTGSLTIEIRALSHETFLAELPFDHYQRYRLAAKLIEGLNMPSATILDVGGALGYLPLFVPGHVVTVVDVVPDDVPYAQFYDGKKLPFPASAFDLVVSIDTLEHLPACKREAFLNELNRVAKAAVLLCGPFQGPHVAEAESVLRGFLTLQLKKEDHFLAEHEGFGLPDKAPILQWFDHHGFSCTEIPNGYLPRWLAMQMALFAMGVSPELAGAKARLNSIYNTQPLEWDNQTPAYRHAILATRGPLPEMARIYYESLKTAPVPKEGGSLWDLASLTLALSHYRVIQEKDETLAHHGEHMLHLVEHAHNLEQQLKQEQIERRKLREHSDNLLKQNHQVSSLLASQQKDAANYHTLNKELLKNQEQMAAQAGILQEQQSRLLTHTENLQAEIAALQKHNQNCNAQITALVEAGKEKDKHAANLQELLSSLQAQIVSLQAHATNLESLLHAKETHAQNLENEKQDLLQHSQALQQEQTRLQQAEQDHARQWAQLQAILGKTRSVEMASEIPLAPEVLLQQVDMVVSESLHKNIFIEKLASMPLVRLLRSLKLLPRN